MKTAAEIVSFLPTRSYETLCCLFKDSIGVAAVVANPKFSLIRDKVVIIDSAPMQVVSNQTGWYTYGWWLTDDYVPGLYDVRFIGTLGDINLSLAGQIHIGEITRAQFFINRLLSRLLDKFFEKYLLDAPERQWRDQELFSFLLEALDTVNMSAPITTFFTFDDLPCEAIFLDIAQAYALMAMARLENANTFSYADGISLNLNRAPFYQQQAQYLLDNALKVRLPDWKYSSSLIRPKPLGIRRAKVPFRVMRTLGFMPNMSRSFSF